MWNLRKDSSIWSDFFVAKFGFDAQFTSANASRSVSPTFKRICEVAEAFKSNTYLDPISQSLVWRPRADGTFTIKSAWESIRMCKPKSFIFNKCWHKSIPLKCSFVLLKILLGRLPLQPNLYSFGIQGPSKCFCCNTPSTESEDHIFILGDHPTLLWQHFEGPLGISMAASSVTQKLMKWWLPRVKNEYIAFAQHVLPILICWELWKVRNTFIFDGKIIPAPISMECIFLEFSTLFKIQFPYIIFQIPSSLHDFVSILETLSSKFQIKKTLWTLPPTAQLKLNIGGCFLPNSDQGGGGGVLRNDKGRFVLAFASVFKAASSLDAEITALSLGITICQQQGFKSFLVESDSKLLVDSIKHSKSISWNLKQDFQIILEFFKDQSSISHCFRESNQVAVCLARFGFKTQSTVIMNSFGQIPPLARGFLNTDSLRLASFRFSKH